MTDPIDFGRGLQLSLTLLHWNGDDLERETSEARVCLARTDWAALRPRSTRLVERSPVGAAGGGEWLTMAV